MNNKTLTILTLALAFLGGFLFFYRGGPTKELAPIANQTSEQSTTKQTWETKTEEQESVTVVVTPLDLSLNSKEWKFNIVMDTHSVELDQDMTKIAVLVDDQGKEYKPIRWEGAEAGGHHREGVLIFNRIKPVSKSVELKISGIGDVVRSFTW
jgi:ATP-dependent protease ClpP protease subunit